MDKKKTWVNNPTKKQTMIMFGLWFTGIVLLILSITNLFSESPFEQNNIAVWLLVFGSTMITLPVIRNYFKNKKTKNHNIGDE